MKKAMLAILLFVLCLGTAHAQSTAMATDAQRVGFTSQKEAEAAHMNRLQDAIAHGDTSRIVILLSRPKAYTKTDGTGSWWVNLGIDPYYKGKSVGAIPLWRALVLQGRRGTYTVNPKLLVDHISRPENIVLGFRTIKVEHPGQVRVTGKGHERTMVIHQVTSVRTDARPAEIFAPDTHNRSDYQIRHWRNRTAYWDTKAQKAYVLQDWSERIVEDDGSVTLRAGFHPVFDQETTTAFRQGVRDYKLVGNGYWKNGTWQAIGSADGPNPGV